MFLARNRNFLGSNLLQQKQMYNINDDSDDVMMMIMMMMMTMIALTIVQ